MKLHHALIFLVILVSTLAWGYEYEPFHCYYALKSDKKYLRAIDEINKFSQARLATAIKNANKHGSCIESALEESIKDQLDDEIYGKVEDYTDTKMDDKLRCGVGTKNSIYATEGIALPNMMDILDVFTKSGGLQGSVYICGTHVGADKFGHFMAQGNTLHHEFKSGGLKKAIDYNRLSEETFYGLSATGVKSFGDMGANLSGMYFWNNLYSKDGTNKQAYVTCQNGKFVETDRVFDWCDHVNPSWDEANNCSDFGSRYKSAVPRNLKALAEKYNKKFQCPMEASQCAKAYRSVASLKGSAELVTTFKNGILNDSCYEAGKAQSLPAGARQKKYESGETNAL